MYIVGLSWQNDGEREVMTRIMKNRLARCCWFSVAPERLASSLSRKASKYKHIKIYAVYAVHTHMPQTDSKCSEFTEERKRHHIIKPMLICIIRSLVYLYFFPPCCVSNRRRFFQPRSIHTIPFLTMAIF